MPSKTTHDINFHQELLKAYEIDFCLMGLGSDVKRQLSLLLSSVNKTWCGRRLISYHRYDVASYFKVFSHSCVDANLYIFAARSKKQSCYSHMLSANLHTSMNTERNEITL